MERDPEKGRQTEETVSSDSDLLEKSLSTVAYRFEEKLGKSGTLSKEEIEKFLEEYNGTEAESGGDGSKFHTHVTKHLFDIGREHVSQVFL